jgi:hypothetical protein
MSRPFLTGSWRNLILAQYAVPEATVRPYLPPGVEPDQFEGRCFVSLVGFQFLNTKVVGVGWPTFRHFPEWNLRIYVRHEGRRGVVFVREFVPQRLVAWVARVIYNEPYRRARLTMAVDDTPATRTAHYTVDFGGRVHEMRATGSKPAVRPAPDCLEHFFKEHSWGYGRTRRGKLIRYEVSHPVWDIYPVTDHHIDVDWAALYGPEWGGMTGRAPDSVVLAAGSDIAVFPKGTA